MIFAHTQVQILSEEQHGFPTHSKGGLVKVYTRAPCGKVCGASLYICFCMAQVPELNNKFLLSGGFILAIISTTFVLTREYMLIHELQDKVEYINERATRLDNDQQEQIDELKDKVDALHR